MTGQAQATRARTTDPGAPQARVLKRAPRPPVPVAQGEDWPGPGQQEASGTVRSARPAWLLVAVGPDAADRKGGREGSCDGQTQAPNRPRVCLRRYDGQQAGL